MVPSPRADPDDGMCPSEYLVHVGALFARVFIDSRQGRCEGGAAARGMMSSRRLRGRILLGSPALAETSAVTEVLLIITH